VWSALAMGVDAQAELPPAARAGAALGQTVAAPGRIAVPLADRRADAPAQPLGDGGETRSGDGAAGGHGGSLFLAGPRDAEPDRPRDAAQGRAHHPARPVGQWRDRRGGAAALWPLAEAGRGDFRIPAVQAAHEADRKR